MQAATGMLEVQVNDAETNELLPARLVLRASDGTFPGDRLDCVVARWPYIEAHGVFISGRQVFELPTGHTSVTAAHGLEFLAESQTIEVEAGKTVKLSFHLHRLCDMRTSGWVAGDVHVHMLHGENQRQTSYADVAQTCAANGLDFVSVGQEYVGAGKLDLKGYVAECDLVSTKRFRMLLGGELPKSLLGHHVVLGVSNPFVISEDPPYFKSARKIHAQGGMMIPVHPVRYYPGKQYQGNWLDFPGNNLARELVFDSLTGPAFDGLSVLSDEPANEDAWRLWFQLLNRGCFVPVFADSDACFDRPTLGLKAPGFWTTYLHLQPETAISQQTVADAVRRGETIATTGPVLQFKIGGKISGSTLEPTGQPVTVEIDAWYAQHAFSLETKNSKTGKPNSIARIELIRNGTVVRTWEPNETQVSLKHTIMEQEKCWYVVRVFGTDQRWQVGVASPIYFASQPVPSKREPSVTVVRGRIYDFKTGVERLGTVEIRRDDEVLCRFEAQGQFQVKMPLDAEITVQSHEARPIRKNLLLDYAPVHKFLWYLEARDLGKAETFELFEHLVQAVELEFPLGSKLPGCYIADELPHTGELHAVKIIDGPERRQDGTVAIAAVVLDTEQILPGDSMRVAVIYRDEGDTSKLGPLVVEARGYDPSRPTAYGALKKFAEFEKTWKTALDLGNGYKLISGVLKVAEWVELGPTGSIDLSIRARQGNGDAAFLGLQIPIGPTKRALSLSSAWPIMPVSWPDGRYGVGPFQVCNRIGRMAQSKADYRLLHLELDVGQQHFDLLPARDGQGCPDADDATFAGHYLDQILSDQSHLAQPDPVRIQPVIKWRSDVPQHDATTKPSR
ncbi:MAG: WD40-like beta Propeller containing protein [Planctomycetaceae bacterium]|nr:WD40-like beta Propeller containing protein [Planctomycetaceae bacterium]